MTTRTKEEQELLDEKIARIQKKNEEILRRQKEIEEDKRLAEEQNAVVKLRSSSANVSRERTPALKPSNRELREEFSDDTSFQEPVQRSTRGSFRGRRGERYRGQGDWKTTGPPPDPKSFLYDDERDAPPKDKYDKGDVRRDSNRGRRGEEREGRDDYRGGREFQRGGRRGGGDHRMERGRRGGRGGSSRSEEMAWREERMRIDEARIQRQKSADGKWRREWDNEKIMLVPLEEPRFESRRANPVNQDQWRPSNQHHGHVHIHSDNCPRRLHRGGPAGGGRGRGRLDPIELEMPLEKFQIEVLQKQMSPPIKFEDYSFVDERQLHKTPVNISPPTLSPSHRDEFRLDPVRTIECVGNSVKISIPNSKAVSKPQRQTSDSRGRFRHQTSYSSQSDDDSPRDRGHRSGRRQRNQKYQKNPVNNYLDSKTPSSSDSASVQTTQDNLPSQKKPPLPPFRSDLKPSSPAEVKDGDESWEDVTTSGTESMGEDFSSVDSSPLKKTIPNTMVINSSIQDQSVIEGVLNIDLSPNEFMKIEPLNYEEYFNQMDVNSKQDSTKAEISTNELLHEQIILAEVLEMDKREIELNENSHVDVSNTASLNDIKLGSVIGEETLQELSTASKNEEKFSGTTESNPDSIEHEQSTTEITTSPKLEFESKIYSQCDEKIEFKVESPFVNKENNSKNKDIIKLEVSDLNLEESKVQETFNSMDSCNADVKESTNNTVELSKSVECLNESTNNKSPGENIIPEAKAQEFVLAELSCEDTNKIGLEVKSESVFLSTLSTK